MQNHQLLSIFDKSSNYIIFVFEGIYTCIPEPTRLLLHSLDNSTTQQAAIQYLYAIPFPAASPLSDKRGDGRDMQDPC